MGTYNMKKKYSLILLIGTIVFVGIFIYLYITNDEKVEAPPPQSSSLDDWSADESVLNGAPLVENKNIYMNDSVSLDSLYITVFPTENSGETLDFSAFDLHSARDHSYNPVLNANIVIGDENGNLPAMINTDIVNSTIKVRGNSSRGAAFKSYKIKITDDETNLNGLTSLNINKHVGDASKIANKFAMDLISKMDNMASLRTQFVKVYIRDASLPKQDQSYVYYGLHTNVEQPNKAYLTSHGLDQNGALYKARNFEFREYPQLKNIDDPSYSEESFEEILGIRESKDHSKLLEMLEDINDLNVDFNESFSKYFNEENYLTWVATNVLLGNEDTIAHNFLLYNPTNSLTWYMLPWDYDGCFNFGEFAGSYSAPISLNGIQRMSGVLLHRRYFLQKDSTDKLIEKMDYIMDNYLTEEIVTELLDSYKPILEQTMTLPPDIGLLEMPPNKLNSYLDKFYDEIQTNYNEFLESMNYPTPMFTSEPEKTDDGYKFAWEQSRDFSDRFVKYSIRLSKNPEMTDIVFEAKDLTSSSYIYDGELSGAYYMEITATNSDGYTQCSLDSYLDEINPNFYFGIRRVEL